MTSLLPFADRDAAGAAIADVLRTRGVAPDGIVVGLPRGGVAVAAVVADALGLPLDVIIVRKLGVPDDPEFAMGAIGEGSVRVLDTALVRGRGIVAAQVAEVEERERVELERRRRRYRAARGPTPLAGRTVFVVDDGVATGSTARAACQVARAAGARRSVLATPVAPPGWTETLDDVADELIAVHTPLRFRSVGQFYDDFAPVTDDTVVALLTKHTGDPHGR